MLAIADAYRAGLFAPRHWLPNIVSGLVVGIVALPLALAFAIASGVRPEQGLYTALVAGTAAALLGGSRVQISGPTGAFIVILSGIVARHGVDGLLLATFMAGAMLVAMGVAKFGVALRFIPDPVISGFTAGIGVIILLGQWPDFLGLPHPAGAHIWDKTWHLLRALPHTDPATAALGAASLLTLLLWPRLSLARRIPGPLVALVLATALHALPVFSGAATIATQFGGIPAGLPALSIPALSFDRAMELLPSAFTIAMLGAIESLLSAVVADGMAGTRHDPNQELIGQGVSNLLSPLFGGIASTGAIARTATNVRNGGTTPLAAIVHALTILLVLLVLAPLAGAIPLCALAAILFVVAWTMSDAPHFLRLLRTAPRADVAILLITFALTILTDLVIAVNIGVILAILQFLRRMAASVEIVKQTALAATGTLPPGVMVFAIEGPLFFAATERLHQALVTSGARPRCVILRLGQVPFMDITGLDALREVTAQLERDGARVIFCESNARVLRKMLRAGVLRRTVPKTYFGSIEAALADIAGKPEPA